MNIPRILKISGLHKVLHKIFPDRCLAVQKKALDSEYATVINMLGLHTVVNKILYHRYLTGF